jgi:two-component system chemotaxis response regulator CheB
MNERKIKILIIEDSVMVQKVLQDILKKNARFEIIGIASDPYIAAKKIANEVPDVITLDIEMPRMNGLTFLKKLMRQHPIPVVVISSLTEDRSDVAIKALELGASEVINKPRLTSKKEVEEYQIRIGDAVIAAAKQKSGYMSIFPSGNLNEVVSTSERSVSTKSQRNKIIAIGASTGGVELISDIIQHLRNDLPPIVIVQHMPGEFTRAFAKRLNQDSDLTVKEAEQSEILKIGHVYIANGDFHLVVKERANDYVCELVNGELVNRHRPSVDVLFESLTRIKGRFMGVLLTGMGKDGARGLLELKEKGAVCIAQNEESSVVFGMPKEAIQLGAAEFVGDPLQIINWINNFA